MLHPVLAETLARDHHDRLVAAAERSHLRRELRFTRRRPIRTRAGWWLVDRGIRMVALGDRPAARPTAGTTYLPSPG